MNAVMAELPVTNLQPMKSSSWVGSPWFYVCLTLAVTITIGLCIKKRKTIKKWGGICCSGCWTGCRKRGSDGDQKGSSKDTVFGCENPEKRTSGDIIELEPIPKVTRIQEKPRRSGRIATRKLTSNTGTISTKLAQQFLGEEENEDYPWTKYYRPDPELARKYLEEKAAMSTQQRNAGDAPRKVASPSAPTLYPRVPMMDE